MQEMPREGELLVKHLLGNEHLADLLKPEYGGRTGKEKAKRLSPTVTVHSSKTGSHRFVKHDEHGNPISAIQVMSREKGTGIWQTHTLILTTDVKATAVSWCSTDVLGEGLHVGI